MSGKIKSKDLSYDSTLPPFLQRLHDKNASRGDTDRHERPLARPKRDKDPNEDDGPTVVDESGETLTKDEFERLTKAEAAREGDVGGAVTGELKRDGRPEASGALPGAEEMKRGVDRVTDGLASKKRKAVKVVGDDAGGDRKIVDAEERGEKVVKKQKKKAKPIKLAFDDEEG
ncbi:hypothetical protein Tdes44962_MAKER02255 [Teratosphaeria destructans]|uniref:DUF4604 domain-containing protein n=1 Tax=Teratosphaeria destructans TaxID=418781 RepID=A0A9W7SUF9_9PEZI|nr:hypothetical protein Tdes44962_MAKER02255 [Teratosphaeria destructans]